MVEGGFGSSSAYKFALAFALLTLRLVAGGVDEAGGETLVAEDGPQAILIKAFATIKIVRRTIERLITKLHSR